MQKCSVFMCKAGAWLRHLQTGLFSSTRTSGRTSKSWMACGTFFSVWTALHLAGRPASRAPPLNASSTPTSHYENESTPTTPKTAPWVLYRLPEGLFQIPDYVSCLSTPGYPQAKSKFLSRMPKVLLIRPSASSPTGRIHNVSPPSPLPTAHSGRADD